MPDGAADPNTLAGAEGAVVVVVAAVVVAVPKAGAIVDVPKADVPGAAAELLAAAEIEKLGERE